MERVRELALRNESNALMRPSEACLPDVEYSALAEMVMQLHRAFAHQDLADSMEILSRGFELLAVRHGLPTVRDAMTELLIEPGRRFFPLPGEVAEMIRRQREARVAAARAAIPLTPCGQCEGGLVATNKDGSLWDWRAGGTRYLKPCACLLAWRAQVKAAMADGAESTEQSPLVRMPYRET